MLLQFCALGVTMSWEEAHPGARASRPHKSSRSFSHLLHRNQPAAAPCLCFGRAHAVPAGRAVGCNIAGKLSGNRRDSMRAGRPRSRGCRPDGEVEGIRRATSLKAGLSPLGNSRLPASRAPAPRDWADHPRVKQVLFQVSGAPALSGRSSEGETGLFQTSGAPALPGRSSEGETGLFQTSPAPAPHDGAHHSEEKQPFVNEDEPPMNTNRHED